MAGRPADGDDSEGCLVQYVALHCMGAYLKLPNVVHMHVWLRLAVSGEALYAAQRIAPDSPGSARCMHVKAFTIRADL